MLFLYLLLSVDAVWAQSYHFSQFFSTPLLTNPANTGFTDGPYRVASNIRSQGMPGNTLFTGYLSADISPLRRQLTPGHKAGLGMYIMNDHSLNSAIQTNSIGMSVAYNLALDPYSRQSFGLGLQGTYNQRRIDYSKLTFENQYGPAGYDPSLSIGEPLDVNSKHFFDVNAGVIYNKILDNRAFFAGIAVYNILGHNENITGDEFKMPVRFTFQAGAQLYLKELGKVYMSLTTMRQARANEITLGGAYGLLFSEKEDSELIGGIWYRFKDAFIPYLGYQYNNFKVGFSYDYTVSSVKTSAQIRNGYEVTLQIKAADKRELKTNTSWY